MSNTSFGTNVLTNNFEPACSAAGASVHRTGTSGSRFSSRSARSRHSKYRIPRRTYSGFFVADNLALQPSDLTPFSIAAPADPRLPGGGGYIVSGLYDVVPAKSGQVNNLVDNADQYGSWSQSFNGVDVTAHVRLGSRFVLVGGSSTGQTVADNCEVRARLPELATTTTGTSPFGAGLNGSTVSPVSPYCHAALRVAHAGAGPRVVRRAEGRSRAVGDVPEQARSDALGQLRRAELGGCAVAREKPVRQCGQRHGQSRGARCRCTAIASTSSMFAWARR